MVLELYISIDGRDLTQLVTQSSGKVLSDRRPHPRTGEIGSSITVASGFGSWGRRSISIRFVSSVKSCIT